MGIRRSYDSKLSGELRDKFLDKCEGTFKDVKDMLESDSFDDFFMACNYLEVISHEDLLELMSFDEKRSLKLIANERVREILGKDISDLFDMAVRESKHEMWSGDELYELYSCLPAVYVKRCIKSALYIREYIHKDIYSVCDFMKAYRELSCISYWRIYRENLQDTLEEKNKVCERECKAWYKIAEYLFYGKYDEATKFLKENDEYRHEQ